MITNDRLQFWASSTARLDDSDTAEKIAMARELLDRRGKVEKPAEKVEVVKLCDCVVDGRCESLSPCGDWYCTLPKGHNGDHVACLMVKVQTAGHHRNKVWKNHSAPLNPAERAEIEPWIEQLQRRVDAMKGKS
jgi:hypothetical protein